MEDVIRMEKDYDNDLLLREVFQTLLSVEEEGECFPDKIQRRHC